MQTLGEMERAIQAPIPLPQVAADEPITLEFICRQVQRLTADVGCMRRDMAVMATIILRRLDDGQLTGNRSDEPVAAEAPKPASF